MLIALDKLIVLTIGMEMVATSSKSWGSLPLLSLDVKVFKVMKVRWVHYQTVP